MSTQRFIIFLLFFSICFTLSAQERVSYDLLYLKDGGFLKGHVVEESTTLLQWKLTNGDIIPIAMTHVERIEKSKKSRLVYSNGKTISESGAYHVLLTGVLLADGAEFEGIRTGANVVHFIKGIKFNQFLSVGLGAGFDSYDHEFVPVYLDVRGDILNRAITPYYAINAGYAYSFAMDNQGFNNQKYKGGVMIHPAIGVRFASKRNVNFLLEAGYKFQKGEIEYENRNYTDRITYKRLALRGGIIF